MIKYILLKDFLKHNVKRINKEKSECETRVTVNKGKNEGRREWVSFTNSCVNYSRLYTEKLFL